MDASITKVLEAVQEEFAPRRPRSSSSRQTQSRQSSAASTTNNNDNNANEMPGASPSSSYEPTFASRLSASPAAPGFSFDSSMAEQDSYSHLDEGGDDGDRRQHTNTAFADNVPDLETPRAERSEPVMMSPRSASAASGAPTSHPASTVTEGASKIENSDDANVRARQTSFGSSRAQPSSSSSSTSYSANRAKRNSLNSAPSSASINPVDPSQNPSFSTGFSSSSSSAAAAAPSFISLPAPSSSNSGASVRKTSTSDSFGSKLAGSDHILLTPGVDDIPFTFKKTRQPAPGARPGMVERRNSQQEVFA